MQNSQYGAYLSRLAEDRITSYNVCYTKLLRAAKQRDISVSEFFAKNRHLLGFDNPSVITSYSIHYTKLYDGDVRRRRSRRDISQSRRARSSEGYINPKGFSSRCFLVLRLATAKRNNFV